MNDGPSLQSTATSLVSIRPGPSSAAYVLRCVPAHEATGAIPWVPLPRAKRSLHGLPNVLPRS